MYYCIIEIIYFWSALGKADVSCRCCVNFFCCSWWQLREIVHFGFFRCFSRQQEFCSLLASRPIFVEFTDGRHRLTSVDAKPRPTLPARLCTNKTTARDFLKKSWTVLRRVERREGEDRNALAYRDALCAVEVRCREEGRARESKKLRFCARFKTKHRLPVYKSLLPPPRTLPLLLPLPVSLSPSPSLSLAPTSFLIFLRSPISASVSVLRIFLTHLSLSPLLLFFLSPTSKILFFFFFFCLLLKSNKKLTN